MDKMPTVAVWGLGKMGLPLACVFADKGFPVTGIDIDAQRVEAINRGINPIPEEPGLSDLLSSVIRKKTFTATVHPFPAHLHIIIIPIMLTDGKADFSILTEVTRTIASQLRKEDIVILESTAPPGTCQHVLLPILETSGLQAGKDFGMAHCPERTMSGTALQDITGSYPKIIGASDKRCLREYTEMSILPWPMNWPCIVKRWESMCGRSYRLQILNPIHTSTIQEWALEATVFQCIPISSSVRTHH